MAEIYNPWQQPSTDNDISFVSTEFFEEGESAEHEGESADAPEPVEQELLEKALSVIDQQSRTIQQLMGMLTGERSNE